MQLSIYQLWQAGGVNRWHYHDVPALRNSGDTNWSHSCRVAQLVFALGGTSGDIICALFHDTPEKITGDIKAGGKSPEQYVKEKQAAKAYGVDYEKTPLVHLCDKLDAYLWARLHGSGKSLAWIESRTRLSSMARDLGVLVQVEEIIFMQEKSL